MNEIVETNGHDGNGKMPSKKRGIVRLVAAIGCSAAGLVLFFYCFFRIGGNEGRWAGIGLFGAFGIVAMVLYTEYFAHRYYDKRDAPLPPLSLPLLAVSLELSVLPFCALGNTGLAIGGIFLLAAFLFVPIVPIVGIILGILCICKRKELGKIGLVYGIVAVALPVLIIVVGIALFSARVIVIRWM